MSDNLERLTLDDVLTARERIKSTCIHTSLIRSYELSKEFHNDVYLKPENLQVTGAFKIRGALNKIKTLSDEEKNVALLLLLLVIMLKVLLILVMPLE